MYVLAPKLATKMTSMLSPSLGQFNLDTQGSWI